MVFHDCVEVDQGRNLEGGMVCFTKDEVAAAIFKRAGDRDWVLFQVMEGGRLETRLVPFHPTDPKFEII